MTWNELPARDIESWVAQIQSSRLPPANYKLAGRDEVLGRLKESSQSAEVRVRDDSFTLERRQWVSAESGELQRIVSFAQHLGKWIDNRILKPGRGIGRPLVGEFPKDIESASVSSWESSIEDVPSVGPGGRVTVYVSHGMTLADITTRVRTESMESRWRTPGEIANQFERITRGEFLETHVFGAFGYYEASKYERQSYLRTAFVFIIDRPTSREGPSWRTSFAVAATESDGIPPDAGLGSAGGDCL